MMNGIEGNGFNFHWDWLRFGVSLKSANHGEGHLFRSYFCKAVITQNCCVWEQLDTYIQCREAQEDGLVQYDIFLLPIHMFHVEMTKEVPNKSVDRLDVLTGNCFLQIHSHKGPGAPLEQVPEIFMGWSRPKSQKWQPVVLSVTEVWTKLIHCPRASVGDYFHPNDK